MINYFTFKAKLLVDDKRTGYKKGKTFDPLGFYYNRNKVIVVGSVKDKHAIRIAFPIDNVEIEVKAIE